MINIVMPVRDRFNQTLRSLGSLVVETDIDYMVTVVDDCSQSDTRNFLDVWGDSPFHHVVHNTENLCVGGSKNRGVEESEKRFGRGDYLYFSDNDVIFTPGWLDTLINAYEYSLLAYKHSLDLAGNFLILGGYSHPFNGTNSTYRYPTLTQVNRAGEMIQFMGEIHEKNAVDGLSWLLTWDTWDKYGKLMDNARGVRQSEDWEYCQRIRNDGYRVGVVYPHVIINNGVVDTFGERIPGADEVEQIEKARMN